MERAKKDKKKQKKHRKEKVDKKYRINKDTISLNIEEFTPPYLWR